MRGIKLALQCLAVYLLLPVFAYRFGMTVKEIFVSPMEYLYFGVGIAVSYLAMNRFGGFRLEFAETFTHELIHSVFVWLSLGKVYEFHVNESTGHIRADHVSLMATLAPYFFPIFTFLLMAIRPGIREIYYPAFDCLAGASFAFYLHMIRNQTGLWQTDIKDVDWKLSYPFLICMLFLCCYLILESVHTSLWTDLTQLGRMILQLPGHFI